MFPHNYEPYTETREDCLLPLSNCCLLTNGFGDYHWNKSQLKKSSVWDNLLHYTEDALLAQLLHSLLHSPVYLSLVDLNNKKNTVIVSLGFQGKESRFPLGCELSRRWLTLLSLRVGTETYYDSRLVIHLLQLRYITKRNRLHPLELVSFFLF